MDAAWMGKPPRTVRGGVAGYDVWWRGVLLPHDVVAVQILRSLRGSWREPTSAVERRATGAGPGGLGRWKARGGVPRKWEACRETWAAVRSQAYAARIVETAEVTVRKALVTALDHAWALDQRTHPGESWCVEMDTPDAQARIGYVLTPPDAA